MNSHPVMRYTAAITPPPNEPPKKEKHDVVIIEVIQADNEAKKDNIVKRAVAWIKGVFGAKE